MNQESAAPRDTRDEVIRLLSDARQMLWRPLGALLSPQDNDAGLAKVDSALALLRAPETQEQTIKVWNIEEACGPTSPFEYDQGDIVAVHYDDLYDLVHPRYQHICVVPSPPAQTEDR